MGRRVSQSHDIAQVDDNANARTEACSGVYDHEHEYEHGIGVICTVTA
jgi:hypothetical protein